MPRAGPKRVATPLRRGVLILITILWLWTWTTPVSTIAESEWLLHARGLGRLTVGMTLVQARELPGIQMEELGPPPVAASYCTYFLGRLAKQEFRVRVKMDRIDRVEVSSTGFLTLSGVGVGDSIQRVKAGVTEIWAGRYKDIRESEGCE